MSLEKKNNSMTKIYHDREKNRLRKKSHPKKPFVLFTLLLIQFSSIAHLISLTAFKFHLYCSLICFFSMVYFPCFHQLISNILVHDALFRLFRFIFKLFDFLCFFFVINLTFMLCYCCCLSLVFFHK